VPGDFAVPAGTQEPQALQGLLQEHATRWSELISIQSEILRWRSLHLAAVAAGLAVCPATFRNDAIRAAARSLGFRDR
jgi:hypothetical protein